MSTALPDPACEMAHGALPPLAAVRTLVAVFASPVASYLLHFARDLGFTTVLVDPADVRAVPSLDPSFVDPTTDIVVTDHDRPELGSVLHSALRLPARWIGVMGSPRHTAPHVAALRSLGVAESDIARVHRPIGLNIGSQTPPEIAIATLAGLIADRNARPGGFTW
jgi:xanthine/CO dehydrogenase XdhC/CoxF family maturation factor